MENELTTTVATPTAKMRMIAIMIAQLYFGLERSLRSAGGKNDWSAVRSTCIFGLVYSAGLARTICAYE